MGLKAAWRALFGRIEAAGVLASDHREAPTVAPQPTVAELAAAINAHHRELSQLRLEWAETLDKMTAWANRQAARDRVRIKAALPDDDAEDGEHTASRRVTAPDPTQVPMFPTNGHDAPAPARHPKADLYARIQRR